MSVLFCASSLYSFQGVQGPSGPPGAKGIAGQPVSLLLMTDDDEYFDHTDGAIIPQLVYFY